jgi:hypothetical protein
MPMKFKALAILLLVLALPLSKAVPQLAKDEAIVHKGFFTTNDYRELGKFEQAMYAAGLVDGIFLAPAFDAPSDGKYLNAIRTCVEGMSAEQVAAIITKHVTDHPETWHSPANVVAWQAMRNVCPVK